MEQKVAILETKVEELSKQVAELETTLSMYNEVFKMAHEKAEEFSKEAIKSVMQLTIEKMIL